MILDLLKNLDGVKEVSQSWLGEDLISNKTLLLYLLIVEGESSPSHLAGKLNLSRGRISHLLDELEADDLIIRKKDPEDGRGQIIALTPAGRGKAILAKDRVIGLRSAIEEKLGEAGFLMLIEQLEKVSVISQKV